VLGGFAVVLDEFVDFGGDGGDDRKADDDEPMVEAEGCGAESVCKNRYHDK